VFKKKEEVAVVAVLAIITSALLSGYGVYYFFNLRLAKVAESQLLSKPQTVSGNSELQSAQVVLENFFNYLASKKYEEAVTLYGWGHDDDPGNNLQAWAGKN